MAVPKRRTPSARARAPHPLQAVRPRCSPARAAATANSPIALPDVRVLQRRQRVTVED